jgi:putative flippase GtrA
VRGEAWLSLRDRLLAGRSVGQFVRFLLTGAVNTAFGYGVYAGLTWALTGRIPGAYVVAAVLGNVLAITFSYLLSFLSKTAFLKRGGEKSLLSVYTMAVT